MREASEEIPPEEIARIVHTAHCSLQVWLEDPCPAMPWDTLSPSQKEMVVSEVRLVQQGFPYDYVHQVWMEKMFEDGWSHGKVKDPVRKRHPDLLPWEKLPFWEQQKTVMAFHLIQGILSRGR